MLNNFLTIHYCASWNRKFRRDVFVFILLLSAELQMVSSLTKNPQISSLHRRRLLEMTMERDSLPFPSHRQGRRRGRKARAPSQKIGKTFFGQLLCKIRSFFGQNHVKFGRFVNFYRYRYFSGKMSCPPKVDWAPTPMSLYLLPFLPSLPVPSLPSLTSSSPPPCLFFLHVLCPSLLSLCLLLRLSLPLTLS